MVRHKKPAPASVRKNEVSPAAIDSSFTIFFVVATIVWAMALSYYFPESLQGTATIVMIAFTFMIYIFRYLLLQFYEGVTVLRMILLYAGVVAALSFLSAVRGPLSDGTVASIQILFLSEVYVYAGPVALTAAVFPFYGAVTTFCAALTASVLEGAYNFLSKFMPKSLRTVLYATDKRLDRTSGAVSWRMFALREWQGIVAVCVILAVYSAVFITRLILH